MTLLQGQALGTGLEDQQQDHFPGEVPPPDEELKMVSQSALIIQASFVPLMTLPTTRVLAHSNNEGGCAGHVCQYRTQNEGWEDR